MYDGDVIKGGLLNEKLMDIAFDDVESYGAEMALEDIDIITRMKAINVGFITGKYNEDDVLSLEDEEQYVNSFSRLSEMAGFQPYAQLDLVTVGDVLAAMEAKISKPVQKNAKWVVGKVLSIVTSLKLRTMNTHRWATTRKKPLAELNATDTYPVDNLVHLRFVIEHKETNQFMEEHLLFLKQAIREEKRNKELPFDVIDAHKKRVSAFFDGKGKSKNIRVKKKDYVKGINNIGLVAVMFDDMNGLTKDLMVSIGEKGKGEKKAIGKQPAIDVLARVNTEVAKISSKFMKNTIITLEEAKDSYQETLTPKKKKK